MRIALLMLATMATPASAAWSVARSAHFTIYAEDKPEALRAFATQLERFDAAMRVLRGLKNGVDSPHNRLTVYRVASMSAVRRLYGKDSGGVAGFYNGRAGASVAFVPRRTGSSGRGDLSAETVLLHEYAHHFMFRNYPAAFPLWFTEGFAEFNSTARFVEDGSVDIGLPAQHRAAGLFYLGQLPIGTLLAPDADKLGDAGREVLYGRGWLLTHYLYFARERDGQLGKYLAALNSGKPSLEAAREAFGDLARLDREIDRYKNQGRINYQRVPGNKIVIAPIEVAALSPGANAMMALHMRSRRGVTEEEARTLVRAARAAAAPYPGDAFAQLALAEAEFDADNLTEAEAAADRVLAAQPGSVPALIYKGRVALKRLIDAKSEDAEAWKQARRWFARANRADPNAPEPLILFYESFKLQGIAPTPNAVDGLQTAAALAPEDDMLRLNLAYQYLVDRKPAQARAALAPAAFAPHGGLIAAAAARVIAALEKDGPEAALKAWERPE